MYCPKCASLTVQGQHYCRNCGTNLRVILDAIEGKRGPLDFETLKRDLRDLGSSIRSGFEEASASIKNKNTKRLDQQTLPYGQQPQVIIPDFSKELKRAVRKVNAADSRKLSLQKGTLSIFGGSAMLFVWQKLLDVAFTSGFLHEIEVIIHQKAPDVPVTGITQLLHFLWLLALIPIARGVAYLINGIFFAPKPEPEPVPQVIYSQPVVQTPPTYVSAIPSPSTNELENQAVPQPAQSVTEDATLRFEPREAK